MKVRLCGGTLKGTAWDPRSPPSPSASISTSFHSQKLWGLSSWLWNPGLGGLVWGWDPTLLRGEFRRPDIPSNYYLPLVGVGPACFVSPPSYQSRCGFFFKPLVIGLSFTQISEGSE